MPLRATALFVALAVLASGATAQTPLHTEVAATGLNRPVLVTAPPGDFDRLFVVEQPGRIKIVRNGNVLAQPFLDLTGTGTVYFGGEMGLLGLAFHPDYASNGQFFVYHTTPPFVNMVVRRFVRSANDPDRADASSGQILLSAQMIYGNHNGGAIAFGPDGMLYVAIGDGGSNAPNWPSDPQNHAQRDDSLLGKMLRIDVDNPQPPLLYGIPPDNPFAAPGNPRDEIWAFGLRNPWRFSFDRLTGDMYLADVGGLREEIDFEAVGGPGGRNYGWSCMSGTQCHIATACNCNAPVLTLPLHEYTTPGSKAVIGGYVYRGAAIPDLRGSYFYADFATGKIFSFLRNGNGIAQLTDRTSELSPPAPYQFFNSIASFGQDGRGELYLCDLSGEVYRIVPDFPVLAGMSPYGAGLAGCTGSHVLDATTSPVLGNAAFELRCTNAPPSGLGLVAIASNPDIPGSDPFGLGFNLHVQWNAPLLSLQVIGSDLNGMGRYPFPIPPAMALAGLPLYAQNAWFWNPAACSPTPLGWSSSHGLAITLQP